MASTTSKMQKLSFQWDIKDFFFCDLVSDEFFESPKFSIPDSTFKSDWILRMYPAGTENLVVRDNLTLLLLRIDSGALYHTKHSISMLKRNGSRFHTENGSVLCQPSLSTDSTQIQMAAKNIIEIKANVRKFLDGGVLSVLFEMEIYDKNEEIQVRESEKHIQLHASSSLLKNMDKPTSLEFNCSTTTFYLPYGKLLVCFEAILCPYDYYYSNLSLKIIDKTHPKITEVPVKINSVNGIFLSNIKRTKPEELILLTKKAVEISTRCAMESPPNAFPIVLTPCARKMRADYRQMFTKSEAGDISIVVGEKTLRAHKDILSSRCPVFANMFSQEWIEQATQTVTICEFDYKTIRALIEFIYYGGEEDDDENAADPVELLKAAHMYQLDDLKNKCELRLCNSLEKDRVGSYITLAETYDLASLKNATFLFVNSAEFLI